MEWNFSELDIFKEQKTWGAVFLCIGERVPLVPTKPEKGLSVKNNGQGLYHLVSAMWRLMILRETLRWRGRRRGCLFVIWVGRGLLTQQIRPLRLIIVARWTRVVCPAIQTHVAHSLRLLHCSKMSPENTLEQSVSVSAGPSRLRCFEISKQIHQPNISLRPPV